jgi:hypothetical protein
MQASQPHSPKDVVLSPCRPELFFSLPRELRDEIYYLLWRDTKVSFDDGKYHFYARYPNSQEDKDSTQASIRPIPYLKLKHGQIGERAPDNLPRWILANKQILDESLTAFWRHAVVSIFREIPNEFCYFSSRRNGPRVRRSPLLKLDQVRHIRMKEMMVSGSPENLLKGCTLQRLRHIVLSSVTEKNFTLSLELTVGDRWYRNRTRGGDAITGDIEGLCGLFRNVEIVVKASWSQQRLRECGEFMEEVARRLVDKEGKVRNVLRSEILMTHTCLSQVRCPVSARTWKVSAKR